LAPSTIRTYIALSVVPVVALTPKWSATGGVAAAEVQAQHGVVDLVGDHRDREGRRVLALAQRRVLPGAEDLGVATVAGDRQAVVERGVPEVDPRRRGRGEAGGDDGRRPGPGR
jgi:hypothetical protein